MSYLLLLRVLAVFGILSLNHKSTATMKNEALPSAFYHILQIERLGTVPISLQLIRTIEQPVGQREKKVVSNRIMCLSSGKKERLLQ